jgi:peroxiredoxin (alkyl hydroperoxide reductase subunit C)
MIDPQSLNNQSIRGVFFIDPENKIKAFLFYPNEVGRNIDEIIRMLKALQTQYSHQNTVMPANWQPGDEAMIPILTKEDKEELKNPESNIHFINWYMIYRKLK